MNLVEEMEGAGIVVETCANIDPNEKVLILSDWRLSQTAERLAAAATMSGAEVCVLGMAPREDDGNEPPTPIAAAMLEADVILLPTSRGIAHSEAVKRSLESGARAVALAHLTLDELLADGLRVDFDALAPVCESIARRFTDAEQAELRMSNGTRASFGLTGREGNAFTCMVKEPGELTAAYAAEANVAPVEGTTNGRIVFDGSIPSLGIGLLDDDVVVEIEDGTVTRVDGGEAATKIEQVWSKYADSAVRNVAELAVGMNPACTGFTGGFINDRGVLGGVHVGLGTSSNVGGQTRTPLHFDATLTSATLQLEGETVVDNGEIQQE